MQIPPEDREPGDEDKCALLHKSLYGTRDAAVNWSTAYQKVLAKLGFRKGASSPCTFWHAARGIAMAVHGDDFVCEGTEEHLKWLSGELKRNFEVKVEVMGSAGHLLKALTLPNQKKVCQLKGNLWRWALVVDGTVAAIEPVRLQFCQVWTDVEDLFVQLLEE